MAVKRVVSDYNTTAGIYETRYSEEQDIKIGFLLSRIRPDEGALILDVGCGTGMLLKKLKGIRYGVGIDPSVGMLLEAKRNGCKAELILADAGHLPIRSGVSDYVFSVSVLQLLEEPERGAHEILRVLKRGGWIGISALMKSFTGESLKAVFGIDGESYESETMKDAFLIARKT